MSDKEWDDLVDPARIALEALITSGDNITDRIEKLEADLDDKEAECRYLRGELNMTKAKLEKVLSFIDFLDENYRHAFGDTARAKIRELYGELKGNKDQ